MSSTDNTINPLMDLTYSEIVGIVKERNRPSGGLKTVHEVAVNTFLNKDSHVLEIGSNTGFTSANLSLLTGCSVVGIDMVDLSINEATKYARNQGVANNVTFKKSNALDISFDNNHFDLVWASNVTSFIKDKTKALKEYTRVLKVGGYLAFVPIYYISTPPKNLLNQVEEAIGAKIDITSKQDWMNTVNETVFDNNSELELIYQKDYKYLDQSNRLDDYIEMILSKSELDAYSPKDIKAIRDKYTYFMKLFNTNLSYCGYSTLIYQKRNLLDEQELFLTTEC